MLNINWAVRVKNPVFWAQVVCAIGMPLIVGVGMSWSDMTTWNTLGATLLKGISNPVVVVAMITSLWACITDPTTKGTTDPVAATPVEESSDNTTKEE